MMNVHQRFAENPVHGDNAEHFVCVVYNEQEQQWYYDDNETPGSDTHTGGYSLFPFTPNSKTDILVATIDFGSGDDTTDQTITSTQGQNGAVHGIHLGYDDGDLVWTPNQWGTETASVNGGGDGVTPGYNSGEFGLTGTFISMRHNVGEHISAGEINNGIACDDDAAGKGYIMYSEDSVHNRFSDHPPHEANAEHFICVVWAQGAWKYDDNEGTQGAVGVGGDWTLHPFTPAETDVLVAQVDFGAPTSLGDSTVTMGQGVDENVHGIHYGYQDSDLNFIPNQWGGAHNDGEFGITGSFFASNGGLCEGVYDCTHAQLSGETFQDIFDDAGSTGDGFCNFNVQGDAATWSLTGCAVQQVLVRFRYALGFRDSRQMNLYLNGESVFTYDLVPTGSWSTWEYTGSQLITLESGSNTITLAQATSDEPANCDLMEVYSLESDTVFDATYAYRLDATTVSRVTQEDTTIDYCDYTPPPGTCATRQEPGNNGHRRAQMFGAGLQTGTMCDLRTIADRADQVDSACCAQDASENNLCDQALPSTCSYGCAAVYVPFFSDCEDIITSVFKEQLSEYHNLYDSCIPDDTQQLMVAIDNAQCVGRATEWRIQVDSVVGGGPQVQLTEIGFLNGDEQIGAAIVRPTITPPIAGCTNCPDCEQCLNDENPHSGTSNCNPLPCTFDYHYVK